MNNTSTQTEQGPREGCAAIDGPEQTAQAEAPFLAPGISSNTRLFWIGAGVFVLLKLVLMAGLPLVVISHPIGGIDPQEVIAKTDAIYEDVVKLLS